MSCTITAGFWQCCRFNKHLLPRLQQQPSPSSSLDIFEAKSNTLKQFQLRPHLLAVPILVVGEQQRQEASHIFGALEPCTSWSWGREDGIGIEWQKQLESGGPGAPCTATSIRCRALDEKVTTWESIFSSWRQRPEKFAFPF